MFGLPDSAAFDARVAQTFLSGTTTELPDVLPTNDDANRWSQAVNAGNLLVYLESARAALQLHDARLDDMVGIAAARFNSEQEASGSDVRYKRQCSTLEEIGVKREDLVSSMKRLYDRQEALSEGVQASRFK
jgi:hypothetical protein